MICVCCGGQYLVSEKSMYVYMKCNYDVCSGECNSIAVLGKVSGQFGCLFWGVNYALGC